MFDRYVYAVREYSGDVRTMFIIMIQSNVFVMFILCKDFVQIVKKLVTDRLANAAITAVEKRNRCFRNCR